MTTSGEIAFSRAVWQCAACRRSHAQVDLALGMSPKGKWTRGVERKAAFAAAMSPFVGASEALRELAGLDLSASEADRIAQDHGAQMDVAQREAEARWREPVDPLRPVPEPEIAPQRLVIEADATNVLTVKGEEHKSVYCATAFGLDARGRAEERPFIAERLYAASAVSMADFDDRLKALTWRAGLRGAQAAFVADGARSLWKWGEENLPADTVFIQDFWHVCEHLADLAREIFDETSWRSRFLRWKRALRESRLDSVLLSLRRERRKRKGAQRSRIEAEMAYLESGRDRMDYARYKREGWPIGSGAIEGTCKHLVKSRFSVTGARWRRGNIGKTLALRLAIFNKEWDEYWENPKAA